MMAATKFTLKREYTGDRQLDSMQQARNDIAGSLNNCPFVQGVLVSVSFTALTAKVITHSLGAPAACFVVRESYGGLQNAAQISESADQSGFDVNNQLRLVAAQSCTVDLWFYPRASKQIDTATGQST
ncbi:hypothetical protein [Labilithrix luteola]|uniref:hypothetical protein n=1 Tax=Labilithrix luteola TaxID=1391654 RepID=UPI00147289D7|nr:hypothetical protein [Labilithrix luteola]